MDKRRKRKRSKKSQGSEVIGFEQFFLKKVREKKLRPEQDKEIWAFFKQKGLKSKDKIEDYERVLKFY